MKKLLLTAAVFAASVGAFAQTQNEVGVIDPVAAGIGSNYSGTVKAGTELAKTENVTLAVAFDDGYKQATVNGPKLNDASFKSIYADGVQLFPDDNGITGNSNPKDADGSAPATSLRVPVAGCAYKFSIKTDGTLYIFIKASSNKSYTVFESGSPVGYTFAQLAESPLPDVYGYTLTGDKDWNYLNLTDYPFGVNWPEQIYAGMIKDTVSTKAVGDKLPAGTGRGAWAKNAAKKNGVGVVKVNVYQGLDYIFNANGSKATVRGYYFVPGEAGTTTQPTFTVKNDNGDERTLLSGGKPADGISTIISGVVKKDNGRIYNIAGQRVDGAYKGIVIRGGEKFIQR